jgi:putative heme iron utilization protein
MDTVTSKASAARELFLRQSFGVLSTISLDLPGYPFGSVTPYAVDGQGMPVIYISHIAQHTQNIKADSRVSLTVIENKNGSDDVQAQGRVTYVANARPVSLDDSHVRDRYFRYHPAARQYDQTHDFVFFRLEPVRVRYIGGFGQIYWVEPGEFTAKNPFSPIQETHIIDHMNNDHGDALRHCCGEQVEMIGIDAEGFDVRASDRKVRFAFENPIHNMEEARQKFMALARPQK